MPNMNHELTEGSHKKRGNKVGYHSVTMIWGSETIQCFPKMTSHPMCRTLEVAREKDGGVGNGDSLDSLVKY